MLTCRKDYKDLSCVSSGKTPFVYCNGGTGSVILLKRGKQFQEARIHVDDVMSDANQETNAGSRGN